MNRNDVLKAMTKCRKYLRCSIHEFMLESNMEEAKQKLIEIEDLSKKVVELKTQLENTH